jgi:hypothetical protein
MLANQEALEYLVLAQLTRLQQDESRLESLYAQLPPHSSRPKLEERFFALWTEVDGRAALLERMLDQMAPLQSVHSLQRPAGSPSYRPAA